MITKTAVRGIFSALALGAVLAGPAQASSGYASLSDWAAGFTSPDFPGGASGGMTAAAVHRWAETMFDTRMVGGMMATMSDMMDPALFRQWTDIALDPVMINAMMRSAPPEEMEPMLRVLYAPGMFDTMISLAAPAAKDTLMHVTFSPEMWNVVIRSGDPELAVAVMQIAFDPDLIGPILQMTDPQRFARCVERMTDPAFLDAIAEVIDPELMQQVMTVMLHMSMTAPETEDGSKDI